MSDFALNSPDLWLEHLPVADSGSHKYSRGVVLLCGGDSMTGATILAARGAQRMGAGLVKVASPMNVSGIYRRSLVSAIICDHSSEEAFRLICSDNRIGAIVIGPGLGSDVRLRDRILGLSEYDCAVILDADGLNLFAGDFGALGIFERLILTPHAGEFVRLFPGIDLCGLGVCAAAVEASSLLPGSVLVLKGSETVIAVSGEVPILNRHASAYLATAGSGDVLSGMIAAKVAGGMSMRLASAASVWLHGDASIAYGAGLIAEDLPMAVLASERRLRYEFDN